MRTREFIKRIEELGFTVIDYKSNYEIVHNGMKIAMVDNFIPMQISNFYHEYDKLCNGDKEKFFDLLIEYAKTPIEDREEEKKFLIQHKYFVSKASNPVNLVWNKTKNIYRPVRCLFDNPTYQAQFSLKEIEEIKKKLDTDLKDFELVEVKDE